MEFTSPKAEAASDQATPERLAILANDADVRVQRAVAMNHHTSATAIERLSHSSDEVTRRNVVLNANAPRNLLLKLAPQFPNDFFKNPAFDWLLVEDPDLLIKLGQGVLKNILKSPECPESFMKWSVQHGSEQDKLAVAMNPRAPAEVIETLSKVRGKVGKAAKSHTKIKQPTESAAPFGRGLVEAEVRIALSELDPDEARSYWKRGIIGPSKWSALNLRARFEILGLDGWEYRDDWVLQHADELAASPDELLRKMAKAANQTKSPELIKARSAQTDTADLTTLATSKDIEIVVAVAENPSTPAEVLKELGNDKRVSVRQAVASNQGAPIDVLDLLAKDKQKDVRGRAASNPSLPLTSVDILAKDKTPEVAKTAKAAKSLDLRAARNVRSSPAELASLSTSKKSEVRLAVAQNPSSMDADRIAAFQSLMSEAGPVKLMELADDPHCPPDCRTNARAKRWWRELNLVVAKHKLDKAGIELPNETEIESLIQMLRDEATAILLAPGETLLANALGFVEGDLLAIPDVEADTACNAKARAVRLMGLLHPKAGPEAMAKRCKSTDWVERLAIACNPACAPNILAMLEKDANTVVAQQVSSTRAQKAVDRERKKKIVASGSNDAISLKPIVDELNSRLRSCKPWLLVSTPWWQYLTFEQRLGIPIDKKTPERFKNHRTALNCLARYQGEPVTGVNGRADLLDVAWNRRYRDEFLESLAESTAISEEALHDLTKNPSYGVRPRIAANPNVSPELLSSLAKDTSKDVRAGVAVNAHLSIELLEMLVRDAEPWVRSRVARSDRISQEFLEKLADDNDESVRANAAANRNLSASWQKRLGSDKKISVRTAVAGNPATSKEILSEMAGDKNAEVRRALAINSATPEIILEKLSIDKDEWVRDAVAKNSTTSPKLLIELKADQSRMVRGHVEDQLEARNNFTTEDLVQLTSHANPYIRCKIARNPNVPLSLLNQFAEDPHHLVRLGLIFNPSTPQSALDIIATDSNETVREYAVSHPNISASILEQRAFDTDERIRRHVASNPSTPIWILERLATDKDQDVRRAILKNSSITLPIAKLLANDVQTTDEYVTAMIAIAERSSTSTDELQQLADSNFWIVRFTALENPQFPVERRDELLRSIFSEFSSDMCSKPRQIEDANLTPEDFHVPFMAVDLLPRLSDRKWAAKAAKSQDWLERAAVTISDSAPPSLLQMLLDDPVEIVKKLAISRLKMLESAPIK
jgi:hypothetical protein